METIKKHQIIKILIGFNLIIFLLPFFNACSNTPLRKEHKEIVNKIEKDKSILKKYRKVLLQDENTRFEDAKRSNDDKVFNGYQLSIMPFRDLDSSRLKEPFFYFSLAFTFLLVSILFMLYFVFKSRFRRLKIIVFSDLILSILCWLILILDDTTFYLDQIKLGYYLFLINLIILFVLLRNKEIRDLKIDC